MPAGRGAGDSGRSPGQGRLKRLWAFIRRWWSSASSGPITALLLGAVAVTQGDTYDLFHRHLSWPITLIVLAGLTSFGGTIETSRRIRQLQREANRAVDLEARARLAEGALIDLVCQELRMLLGALSLNSDGRPSLFAPCGDHFILVGRYSAMPRYRQSPGRPRYPLSAGILGSAWHKSEASEAELPDPGHSDSPRKGWLARQLKLGVEETVATAFVMKSRSYAAIRLDDDHRSLGVLVVECERPASQTQPSDTAGHNPGGSLDALRALDSSNEVLSLCRILNHLRDCDEEGLRDRVVERLLDG